LCDNVGRRAVITRRRGVAVYHDDVTELPTDTALNVVAVDNDDAASASFH